MDTAPESSKYYIDLGFFKSTKRKRIEQMRSYSTHSSFAFNEKKKKNKKEAEGGGVVKWALGMSMDTLHFSSVPRVTLFA